MSTVYHLYVFTVIVSLLSQPKCPFCCLLSVSPPLLFGRPKLAGRLNFCLSSEEEACFPLQIPNAEFKASSDAWFTSGRVLRIECEEGYKHKDFDATAVCENGSWSSVPVCESKCGMFPKAHSQENLQRVFKEK